MQTDQVVDGVHLLDARTGEGLVLAGLQPEVFLSQPEPPEEDRRRGRL